MSARRIRLVAVLLAFALLATACTGESTSDESGQTTTGGTTDTEAEAEEPEPEPAGDDEEDEEEGGSDDGQPEEPAPEPVFAEDPFGGLFADFQASYDRSTDPFSAVDTFCQPHDPAEGRADSMAGITADAIEVGQFRNKLEDAVNLGFGIPVGDPAAMFATFVDLINNECGGIRGRQLDLSLAEFSPLDQTAEAMTSACLELTEDANSVIVMNATGFNAIGALCVAEEHETVMMATTGLATEVMERGQGRIITLQQSQSQSSINLVAKAAADGVLDGKTIGVVYPDNTGVPEAVEQDLIPALEAAGYAPAVIETIGCEGGTVCSAGLIEVVGKLRSEGVDAVFAPFNILSLPAVVAEMANQGFGPGDVLFLQSNFNSQAADLVSSKVAANGGEAAAALYNGAFIVDSALTNAHQYLDEVPPFDAMCLDTYAAGGGPAYDFFDQEDSTPSGMTAGVCSSVRMMARILYHAGDNPTPDSIAEAIRNLGPVDANNMLPAVVDGGLRGASFWVHNLTWTFPCELPLPYDDNNTCIVPTGDFIEGE